MEDRLNGTRYYLHSIFDLARLKALISVIWWWFFIKMWVEIEAIQAALIIYIVDLCLWITIALWKDLLKINQIWFSARWIWDKVFSTRKFWRGMIKIFLYWVWIIVTNNVDIVLQTLINNSVESNIIDTKYYFLWYMAAHEWLSALKKLANLWLPVPTDVIDRLSKFKKE